MTEEEYNRLRSIQMYDLTYQTDKAALRNALYKYFKKWEDDGERCNPDWIADDLMKFLGNVFGV